jgi:hypothetical protein
MIDFTKVYTQRNGTKVYVSPWHEPGNPAWAVYKTIMATNEDGLLGLDNGARDKDGKYPSENGEGPHDIIDLFNQTHLYYLEE